MPRTTDTAAQLAQVQRDREAIREQERALAERERQLLERQRLERAKIIADAFSEVDVGDISKREAARLARAVKRLGIEQLLALIDPASQSKSTAGEPPKAGSSSLHNPASGASAPATLASAPVELAA